MHVDRIAHAESVIDVKTDAGTMRILGSGAADHAGYDGRYRPFMRARSSVFTPPDVVFDVGVNTERKLTRWG